jgi:hypothetical protein
MSWLAWLNQVTNRGEFHGRRKKVIVTQPIIVKGFAEVSPATIGHHNKKV